MALRFRRARQIYRLLRQNPPGNHYQPSRWSTSLHALQSNSFHDSCPNISRMCEERDYHGRRFSTKSQTSNESLPPTELLSFIESTLDKVEGPSHYWLNKVEDIKEFTRRDGVFLVIAGAFLDESGNESVIMFEKVKSLQQRYPTVHIIGFQSSKSIFSDAVREQLLQIIMREFITFPILLSTNNFSEMTAGACYIIFEGFKDPRILYEKDLDIVIIEKAIKNLNVQQHYEKSGLEHKLESTWIKPIQVIKEPEECSSLRNLLLQFPGCIAVDESNEQLFLSDINHHRIIVFDGDGMILDSIGSSPGFEDGEFQLAKLMRPAASFYDATEDCLYFIDSENHAIRRADMERRVVETLYPTSNNNNTSNSFWRWIMDKLWLERDIDTKSDDHDSESFLFPWHMMKSLDNNLFVTNRSFETLWIMDLASGTIKDVVKGFPKVLEICGPMILEKSSILNQMPLNWLQRQVGINCSLGGIKWAGLMSSVATFQDHVVVCDAVGQRLLKLNKTHGSISTFLLSNFGILGLPYWLPFSLERVYNVGGVSSGCHIDHIQRFSVLPGTIDIHLIVDIPEDTVLVERVNDGSIWRQARGTAAEISEAKNKEESLEKVGVAQQWYNELDDLATLAPKKESSADKGNTASNDKLQEGRFGIRSSINTSPGTCEVIINAVMYLKMKSNSNSTEESREKFAARIADHLNPMRGRNKRDPCLQHLLSSNVDLGEVIFMRPLNVKLIFDCLDHPKAKNSKDIILTKSSIDVNVVLS